MGAPGTGSLVGNAQTRKQAALGRYYARAAPDLPPPGKDIQRSESRVIYESATDRGVFDHFDSAATGRGAKAGRGAKSLTRRKSRTRPS
jgi:hypothetical protein